MPIVAAQRNSVYPNFLFTPLKYPLKTFDQCAGMEVVGHVLLRLQRHWLVTAALSKCGRNIELWSWDTGWEGCARD